MYEASQNTFASQVQADLINSNQEKYLRKTLTGQYVPNCLVVNADIRKLRKYAVVKSAIPNLIKQFDEGYAVLRNKTDDKSSSATSTSSVNPVKALWEMKGINFPDSYRVPNQQSSSKVNKITLHQVQHQVKQFLEHIENLEINRKKFTLRNGSKIEYGRFGKKQFLQISEG